MVTVIETTVANIAAVLMQRGIAADEPVTIVIEWVEDSRVIHLSPADQRSFADGALNPPEPTPALQRAVALYRAIMREFRVIATVMRGLCPPRPRDI